MAGKQRITNEEIEMGIEMMKIGKEEGEREARRALEAVGSSHQMGLALGRAQAFSAMKLIAEFLEWKQISQVVDNAGFLKIPGVTSIDDYLESLGFSRSAAYRNLKIARTLSPIEIQLLAQVGFTRKDLLGYASLPDEVRMEIRDGKVINLEKADREEIRGIIEQIILEREEAKKSLATTDRVLAGKEKKINEYEKKLARMEEEAASKGLSLDEEDFQKKIENLKMSFDGYLLRVDPASNIFAHYKEVTPRMRAALISFLHYIQMQALSAYDTAVTTHGDPVMNPELLEDFERWQQKQQM